MRPTTSLAVMATLYAGVQGQNSTAAVSAAGSQLDVVGNATASTSSSAAASTSTGTVTNTGSNPLIPTTISTSCQTFLEYLNGDSSIAACTTPLLSTLSLFTPSSESGTTYTTTEADVKSSLSALCAASPCDGGLLRSVLTQFQGNCSDELTAKNDVVLPTYDSIYILSPLLTAVCSTDVNGDFCLTDIVSGTVPASSSSSSAAGASTTANSTNVFTNVNMNATTNATNLAASSPSFNIQTYAGEAGTNPSSLYTTLASTAARLFRRQSVDNSTVASNSTASNTTTATTTATMASTSSVILDEATWLSSSLPFLFLSPNMTSTLLCTSCTKNVFAAYVSWETAMPYVLGLANSPVLGHQGAIWSGLGTVCGGGFLQSIATQAGQTNVSSGAEGLGGRIGAGVVVGVMGLVWALFA